MTAIFDHLFGGWKRAQARRWRNPDGTEGGIVAVDASVDAAAPILGDAVVWPHASVGYGAVIDADDWWLSGGPCGSRDAFWTAVWSSKHGLRWWVGCKHAISTEELLAQVESTHGANAHAEDYRAAIAFVAGHPGLTRAKSCKL